MKGWGGSGCNGLSVFWLANVANYFSGNHAGIFLAFSDLILPEIEITLGFSWWSLWCLVIHSHSKSRLQVLCHTY